MNESKNEEFPTKNSEKNQLYVFDCLLQSVIKENEKPKKILQINDQNENIHEKIKKICPKTSVNTIMKPANKYYKPSLKRPCVQKPIVNLAEEALSRQFINNFKKSEETQKKHDCNFEKFSNYDEASFDISPPNPFYEAIEKLDAVYRESENNIHFIVKKKIE